MKCNYILVLLIFLFVIYIKTETEFTITAINGCVNNPFADYNKLFDQNLQIMWYAHTCSFEGQNDIYYVYFKTDKLVEVTGYKIILADSAANYPGNVPKTWVFKAKKKEGDSWVEIDERVNWTDNIRGNGIYTFILNNPGEYQYFVYIVTSTQNKGNPVSLAELWLLTPCTNDQTASEKGCTCGTTVCNKGELCKNSACLSTCPGNDIAPKDGCMCGGGVTNICNQGLFCYSGHCLSSCPKNGIAPQNGCTCNAITNICDEGEMCESNNCLSSCPDDDVSPKIGCICGENKIICDEGQMCKDDNCLALCPNDDMAPEIGCLCGAKKVCNEEQMCHSGHCLSFCPKDDVAPINGCICGEDGKICDKGQACYFGGICLYPTPAPVSSLFLIFGLFFAFSLLFSLFL